MLVWILQTGEPLHIDSDNSRPMRAMNLSNELVKNGHDVLLWSSLFDHRQKKHRSLSSLKINYLKKLQIQLIPSPGYNKNISLTRFWDHIILAVNLKKILKKTTLKPDVVFIGFPPIEVGFVMSRWCKKNRIPYIVDVKDQWPDFFLENIPYQLKPLGKIILYPLDQMARYIFSKSNGISTMSEGYLKWVHNKINRKEKKQDIVSPLVSKFNHVKSKVNIEWLKKHKNFNEEIKSIVFVGSHYPSLDFETVFLAMKILKEKDIKINLVICGEGETTLKLKELSKNQNNIIFTGWINQKQIASLSQISSAFICPFKNINNYTLNIPNKIIDALSMSAPILTPLKGEVENLIKKYEVGEMYIEKSPDSLAESIIKLIESTEYQNKLSLNAGKIYNELFSFESVYSSLVLHLEKLTNKN